MLHPTSPLAGPDLRAFVAPAAAGVLALILYGVSLPPGLTWANHGADGGDLLAAALTGGVPHPTGYPTYQLLLRLAIALTPGSPARTGAWLSASCAALAVALLADLAARILQRRSDARVTPAVASLIASLAWAASPLLWGQATIVEVYALNAFFSIGLFWGALHWLDATALAARKRWALVVGLLLGLALGNHLTVALMLPGILALGWRQRRPRQEMAGHLLLAGLGAGAGLLVYLYLPFAASHHPPVNWGDPARLGSLLWVATGRLYASLPFGLPLAELGSRLMSLAALIVWQFLPWGFALALAGLWLLDRRMHAWWAGTLLVFLAYVVYATGYTTSDSLIYLIPAFAMMAIWLAAGLNWGLSALRTRPALLSAVALVAVVAFPVASFIRNWPAQDLGHETGAEMFASSALAEAQPRAVVLVVGDEKTFALWYRVYGLRDRPDIVVFNVNLYGFEWYRRSLADTYPNLLPSVDTPAPVESLIDTWAGARPVYVAEAVGLPLQLEGGASPGVLTRVLNIRK